MIIFSAFLNRVIDDGKDAATKSYGDRPSNRDKLKGALAGFESCRGMSPLILNSHLGRARMAQMKAHHHAKTHADGWSWYWWIACYAAEVEWVCNVVSAALLNQGLPPIIPPTARGMTTAATILGIGPMGEFVN